MYEPFVTSTPNIKYLNWINKVYYNREKIQKFIIDMSMMEM